MFIEKDHPRDNDGKFTDGNGGNASSTADKTEAAINIYSDTPEKDLRESNIPDSRVVVVDMDANIQKRFNTATPKERQGIAFDYIMQNLRGKYPAHDGRVVSIERVGADKMTHTFDERKIRVVPALKALIDAGRLLGVVDVQHKKFVQMAYYDVKFEIGNSRYKARLNVGIRANGDSTLYDIKPIADAKK